MSELSFSISSKTLSDAPTIEGASVFEKRYGLDFCLNISITSFFEDVNLPMPHQELFPMSQ